MHLLVLGATGRVGREAVTRAVNAGYMVTAFVRDPAKLVPAAGVRVAVGDLRQPKSLDRAMAGIDAVVNAVGVDPLKPSTFVTDAAGLVVAAMTTQGIRRYVAITGTAQMPKSWLGAATVALLGLTPVRHGIRDHAGAFAIIAGSALDWTLAGCPYIRNGRSTGRYTESEIFRGGFKTITPGDVADFLVKSVPRTDLSHKVIGIWN